MSTESLAANADYYLPGRNDQAVLELDRWWIERFVQGPRVLEMGCSDGTTTALLAACNLTLEVVEGAERYCTLVRARLPQVTVHHGLYEEFEPTEAYHDIVYSRSLDYAEDPIGLLRRVRGWLAPAGRLHVVVQNAHSLHRRLGVALGLLPHVEHLSPSSVSMGHQRVYTRALLEEHLESAGFVIQHLQGFFLKPFDYAGLEKLGWDLPSELIPALQQVSLDLPPELCQQFYVQVRPGE